MSLDAPVIGWSLTIAGVECVDDPRWRCLNPHSLAGPAPKRVESEIIDGVDGERSYPSPKAARPESLRFIFDGGADAAGDPVANAVMGLKDNLDAFVADVYEATVDTRGTVEAVLTDIDRSLTYIGRIRLEDFGPADHGDDATFAPKILRVTLVDGELALD